MQIEELERFAERVLAQQEIGVWHILAHIRRLKDSNYFRLALILAETFYPYFSKNVFFLDELAICYYFAGYFLQSWQVYEQLFAMRTISQEQYTNFLFNAHFSIPYLSKLIQFDNIPRPVPSKLPVIALTMTSCKRLNLFTQTVDSLLYALGVECNMIAEWICVDDNSSVEDRAVMQSRYPFFRFIWKSPKEKGHAKSMNLIHHLVTDRFPYAFHLEDDFFFYHRRPMLSDCIEVMQEDDTIGQCLVNVNYAETSDDVSVVGGEYKKTGQGLGYYIHYHEQDMEKFFEKIGKRGPNSAYWPHYSLRPGLNSTKMMKAIGEYSLDAPHFEMEYAFRYMKAGYKTAFLMGLSCEHTGRLTKDIFNKSKLNAYDLNEEAQFTGKRKALDEMYVCRVINLDSRRDRWDEFLKQDIPGASRFRAVNGYTLNPTRQLEQLFNICDYNFRRGMIGCALSHFAIWIELLNTEEELYVVLEDDVTVVPYFQLKLKTLVKQLYSFRTWDILFLGHHIYPDYVTAETFDEDMIPSCQKWSASKSLRESRGGTGGYLISREGARKMLEFCNSKGMLNGIDTMMQKACDSLNIFYATPHLIRTPVYTPTSLNVDTDIQRNYDSMRRSFDDRVKAEKEFYSGLGVSFMISETHSGEIPPETAVMRKDSTDASYAIEDWSVCVRSDVAETKRVGLKDESGEFTMRYVLYN